MAVEYLRIVIHTDQKKTPSGMSYPGPDFEFLVAIDTATREKMMLYNPVNIEFIHTLPPKQVLGGINPTHELKNSEIVKGE